MYIGDFNARNSEWWNGDSTDLLGAQFLGLEAQYGLEQVINGPTDTLPNSWSFIDPIFSTETSFITNLEFLFPYFSDAITN